MLSREWLHSSLLCWSQLAQFSHGLAVGNRIQLNPKGPRVTIIFPQKFEAAID
jgi:hypothetical protein